MMNPLVSVIVTAFERKEFLMDALRSIDRQDVPQEVFEVILVKNFSDKIIDNYCNEKGITTIIMNGTIGEYLSCAIKKSKGNIIAFIDDDDEWVPEKLGIVIKTFSANKDIGYFHNNYFYIDYSGKIVRFKRNVEGRKKYFSDFIFSFANEAPSKLFQLDVDFNSSCIAIRKDIMLPFYDDLSKIKSGPDAFFFFLSLLSNVSVYVSSRKLTKYRVHSMNLSRSTEPARKEKEVNRQLSALLALESIFSVRPISNSISYKTLEMLKTEYEILSLIFSSSSKLFVFNKLLQLMAYPRSCSNPMRIRVIMFSFLYLISGSFSLKVFQDVLT